MVVLELEGHTNMLGSGPNQYLQPDYLSPLSSPLDSKTSPLALLAQTCSQIGADGPSAKSIFDTSKRKLSTCSESSLKSDSSSDSSSQNNKEGLNNNSHKESNSVGTGGSSSNSNHRPKSGSSSVSPFNHSSLTHKSSGAGGGKSPVLRSPNSSPVFKPYEMSKPTKEYFGEKNSEKCVPSKSAKQNSTSLSRCSANSSPKVKTPNPRCTPPEHKEISVVDSKKGSSNSGSSGSGSGSSANNTDPVKSTSSSTSDHGASPIIRSGLEVLQQGQFGSSAAAAEYNKRLSALSSLSALGAAGYPPGFDPMNPAFRPPFFGSPHSHAGLGYPLPGQSPYVSYSRVKTASGAETIVPVCKDPYCTGCQYGGGGIPHGTPVSSASSSGASSMNGLMAAAAAAAAAAGFPPSITGIIPGLSAAATGTSPTVSSASSTAGGICPAGCVHPCDHPKFPLSSLPHLFHPSLTSSLGAGYPSSLLSQHSAAAAAAAAAQAQQNATRPYVCNWIVGDNYCGKRFPSSEELLQHLRTHTNSSGSNGGGASSASQSSTSAADSAALAAMVQQQHQLALSSAASPSSSLYSSAAAAALLNPSAMAAAAAAMHHLNPTPPLSPLSAARYHPYAAAKASSLTGLVPPPPTSSAAAVLSSYYPYSALYAQRLGPSVHQ